MVSATSKGSPPTAIFRAASIPLIILGSAVILGWIKGYANIIQLNPSFPPMQFYTALCFFMSGMSLLLITFNRKNLVLIFSAIILLISSLMLIEHLSGVDLKFDTIFFNITFPYPEKDPGRMAFNTAFCFFLGGVCLVLMVLPFNKFSLFTINLSSVLITAIATVSITGYLIGYFALTKWNDSVGMALHTSAGLIILGLSIFLHFVQEGLRRNHLILAPFLAVIFLTSTLTIALWQAYNTHFYSTLQNLSQNQADYIATNLQGLMKELDKALNRIGARWEALGGYNEVLWKIDTSRIIQDFQGLVALDWYDSTSKLREQTKDSQKEPSILKNGFFNQNIKDHFLINEKEKIGYIFIPLRGSDPSKSGTLIAEIDLPLLIEKNLDLSNDQLYEVEIFHDDVLLFSLSVPNSFRSLEKGEKTSTEMFSQKWTVVVYPTDKSLSFLENVFPRVLVYGGVFMTLLLSSLVGLFQWVLSAKQKVKQFLEEKTTALGYLEAILDSSEYSIISTDSEGTILSFNNAAEKMLQWKAHELVNKATPNVFHDKDEVISRAKELSTEFKEEISPGFEVFVKHPVRGNPEEREWTYIRKDGSRFPVRLSVTAIKNEEGKVYAFLGIARDLTPFYESERIKKDMMAVTSHELSFPLREIKGSLDLILKEKELSNQERPLLESASKNTKKLLGLVNDILDIQKIDAGEMEFHFENLFLPELVSKAIEINKPLAEMHRTELKLGSEIPSCTLRGDEMRLLQVFSNLISNAVKHSPEKGSITLSAVLNKGRVRISVEDQGEGIPEKYRDLIFQKFYQIPTEHARRKEGSGLGLNIAKYIVEEHHGKIGFESTPQGTRFWFELDY